MRARSLLLLTGAILCLGLSLSAQTDQPTASGIPKKTSSVDQSYRVSKNSDHRGDPGQGPGNSNFFIEFGAEYLRTQLVGTTFDGGGRGSYAVAFTAFSTWPIGRRIALEAGVGGAIRHLSQYIENVDRSGRGDTDLVSIDMETNGIVLQVPLFARYYFGPGRRGLFLRVGALLSGQLWENTRYYVNRRIESPPTYAMSGAIRNRVNPIWRLGIGHQYVESKFQTYYWEFYFQVTSGRTEATSYRGENNWVNYWQPARYFSVGLNVGGLLGEKQKS